MPIKVELFHHGQWHLQAETFDTRAQAQAWIASTFSSSISDTRIVHEDASPVSVSGAYKPGHKLKTLNGAIIHTWQRWPEWTDVQAEVAEWADCKPEDVAEIETPGGEFITANGVPVAFMDRRPILAVVAE